MFGSIGPMMALVTLSSFKWDNISFFLFIYRVYTSLKSWICNDSLSSISDVRWTFLQMAEDIGAAPIWVFNNGNLSFFVNPLVTDLYLFCIPKQWTLLFTSLHLYAGISHNDEVETASIMPFVQVRLLLLKPPLFSPVKKPKTTTVFLFFFSGSTRRYWVC